MFLGKSEIFHHRSIIKLKVIDNEKHLHTSVINRKPESHAIDRR